MGVDSVNTKTYGSTLSQNLSLRVLWLTIGWGLALVHRPAASACFLLLGIVGIRFTIRSHRVSALGALLGMLIFLHPFLGVFFEKQPQLWSQDWLISSVGFAILIFLLICRRQHIEFDPSFKYAALVIFGFALFAVVAVMSLETQLWVLGAGYDNSTHFRDMFESVAQPIISYPFPSNAPRTFAIITGLALRVQGVSSDDPTSSLLNWYLVSLFASTAALIYASAKVIAKNLKSKILVLSCLALLLLYICLTPISQTFISGNPTQVFAIFLVFYYFWPALRSQTRFSVNAMLIIGSLYLVNACYPFTLVLLVPVVAARCLELLMNHDSTSSRFQTSQSRYNFSDRQFFSLITVAIILLVTFLSVHPYGNQFFSQNWNQFIVTFSLVGGIEPYRERVSYVIVSSLSVLFMANIVLYRFRNNIGSTLHRFRANTYMSIMGIGSILIALLISKYSESITDGGTYYAMKLSYSAAIISLLGIVALVASFLQALITNYQRQNSSSEFLSSKGNLSLGVIAIAMFLSIAGYALHTFSQQSPGIFQRAYMGTIPKFISEFNDPGSSGINTALVAFAAQESKSLNRPVFLVTDGTANRLGTIWANEISGFWSYQLWESINHVPPALSEGDMKMVADYFEGLEMILITDDATLLMRLQSEVPTLVGCTLDEINIGMCDFQKRGST